MPGWIWILIILVPFAILLTVAEMRESKHIRPHRRGGMGPMGGRYQSRPGNSSIGLGAGDGGAGLGDAAGGGSGGGDGGGGGGS